MEERGVEGNEKWMGLTGRAGPVCQHADLWLCLSTGHTPPLPVAPVAAICFNSPSFFLPLSSQKVGRLTSEGGEDEINPRPNP